MYRLTNFLGHWLGEKTGHGCRQIQPIVEQSRFGCRWSLERLDSPVWPFKPVYAPVAQLDRASDYGSEGLGFESLRARYINAGQSPFSEGLFLNGYITPWIGSTPIGDLDPQAVVVWQRQLAKNGGTKNRSPLSPNTTRLARAPLNGTLKHAARSPNTGLPNKPETS